MVDVSVTLDFLSHMPVWLRGMVLGVLIAAPVGPIGLLCIRRTLTRGLSVGFLTGLGAALADGLFASVAALGVSSVVAIVNGHYALLQSVGGFLLLGMAWFTYRSQPHVSSETLEKKGFFSAFYSGLLLTLTNPITMMAIMAVVTSLGGIRSTSEALTLIGGIGLGSAFWWLFLCLTVAILRRHVPKKFAIHINHAVSVVLAVFGAYALFSAGFVTPVLAGAP